MTIKQRTYKDQPRPVRYRRLRDGMDGRELHDIRLALALLYEDEGRVAMDKTIRSACYDVCDAGDLRAVRRLNDAIHAIAVSKARKTKVGTLLGCEIMDAISRLWDEKDAEAKASG